jgi:predicted acyl esterase
MLGNLGLICTSSADRGACQLLARVLPGLEAVGLRLPTSGELADIRYRNADTTLPYHADWVVKIIDVWPDEVPSRPELSGYQQLLSADIFRGRYREDLTHPHPIASNQTLLYRFRLPNASHTFLPGHRIMVQIQSSRFPLYDRNPQRFVPNIMFATPRDYIIATQRIWHTPAAASAIDLPVIASP